MAWSETMFIIQHFYNVFDVDKRLTNLEYKSPLISKSVDGLPILEEDTTVEDLTPGILWFIEDDNNPTMIKAVSILDENHVFADPIPFSIDLNNISLDETLTSLIESMGLTANNFYDIIKLMLEILVVVPVERGGTGRTSISKDKVLVGDSNNTFKEIGFDTTPTSKSENLVNSGALYNIFAKYAEKNHASASTTYGLATENLYGHVRIASDYENPGSDPDHTTLNITALAEMLKNVNTTFQILDEETDNETLYSSCISAYRPSGMDEDELRLIDSYFSVEINSTGDYTLIV